MTGLKMWSVHDDRRRAALLSDAQLAKNIEIYADAHSDVNVQWRTSVIGLSASSATTACACSGRGRR